MYMYIMYLSGELCDLLLSLFLYSSELVPETSLTLMPAGLQLGWREGGREGGRRKEGGREVHVVHTQGPLVYPPPPNLLGGLSELGTLCLTAL